MQFSLVALLFAAASIAAPIDPRAVFTQSTYDNLSISGGNAGNAKQEAIQKLGGLPEDFSAFDEDDIKFLDNVNSIANKAEKEAFNPAIKAASGAAADALQRGKIKNKVLKLTATILKLQAQQAQGSDVTDTIAAENKKLQNNISQDEKDAGLPSTFLSFAATT